MRKITLFLASLFCAVGAMAQTAINGVKEIPTEKVDLSQGLESGYYLLKQVNDKGGAASGQGVGWIKAATEAAGKTATSKNTGTPGADGATYVWYVEVVDAANNLITISTANKVAAWQAPFQREKPLVSYEQKATLKYHTGTVNLSGDATPYAGSCFISNQDGTAFVHFSGDNLGSWNDTNINSMFMVEFYKLENDMLKCTYRTEEIANPTEDGVYRIFWKPDNRGYLAYHDSYPTKGVLADVTYTGFASSHFNSATDPVELEWYLITSDNNNKYLFNVKNGKFLSYSDESADAAKAAYLDAARPCPITIEANTSSSYTGYSIIKANINGTNCLLSSGCGTASRTGYPIRWNSNISGDMGDGGSPLTFVKVIDFPVKDAILAQAKAAIKDYENPVEADVNFGWTTSTTWTAVENDAYYTSTVFNDNELDGVKYVETDLEVGGARTATVKFSFAGGSCALNMRGVEVLDALGNVVAADYHVGKAGTPPAVDSIYTVDVAEAGTYKVRCYAAFDGNNRANATNGTINVHFEKLDVMNLTKSVRFAAEYATLYLGYKVAIPAGVEAYIVKGADGEWAHLEQIEGIIPANTGVILKATANNTYNFYYSSDEAADVQGNCLEGSIADRYVQGEAFVLGIPEGETEAALCKAVLNKVNNTSFKNNANKAYLQAVPAAVQVLRFNFDGTTGIEDAVVAPSFDANAPIYDLSGRRVVNAVKGGLYIQNGKKFIAQ